MIYSNLSELPSELGDLRDLSFLDISGNQFNDPNSLSILAATGLQEVNLSNSQLTGLRVSFRKLRRLKS